MAVKGKKTHIQEDESVLAEFARRFKDRPLIFIGTIAILVLVIVAFVFLPAVVPGQSGPSELVFGSYDGIPVKYVPNNYFDQQLQYIMEYYRQMTGGEINNRTTALQMWRTAYEETVINTATLKQAKDSGYTPQRDLVDKRITQLPDFQENGIFSITRYRQLRGSDRMNLRTRTGDSMTAEHFAFDLMGLKPPQGEIDFIKSMAERQRTFKMVSFSLYDYPDSEVSAFAAENPGLFRVIQLSRITINSSEREAQQILASIKDGSLSFEDAVSAHSQDSFAGQGGNMGQRMAYELFTEIADGDSREKVLSLARGAYSDVVTASSGWAIYRCDEASRPIDASDASLNSKIKTYLMGSQRGRVENWCRLEAENFAGQVRDSGDFESAVQNRGLSATAIGPLPLNYGQYSLSGGQNNIFGAAALLPSSAISELAEANEQFWTEAFSTPVNTPSAPIVLGFNVVVLYPESETMAEESSLENIEYMYPYQSQNFMQQDMRLQILTSSRFRDRFTESFNRWVWPAQ
ncbi:MAG: SurA N-terminal domain-containing protein [Spirochaetaceae bacterium]|jgi:hypothetical protein|nr:SurA N-terminal domain-containing protein [Spirochaetaceae bacterium]